MYSKDVYTDKPIIFYFPLQLAQKEEAIEFVRENGIKSFISYSNLEWYVQNVFPLSSYQLEKLEKLSPEEGYAKIEEYIKYSAFMWDNYSSSHNLLWSVDLLDYKMKHYGTEFLLGNTEALTNEAIVFPLTEEELYIMLDVIKEKGIRFFVEHCKELPVCCHVKNNKEDTIVNFTMLYHQHGGYWLLGQLNTAAILNLKNKE